MKTILVLGATGFTGKRVASELSRISNVRYIIAGRDSLKLDALKDSLKGNLPFKTIIVDTSSYIQLEDALKGITVCINCVGPFRFHGEKVVETCINLNVHYVDINGETEFLENMHLKYDNLAKQSKTTIVSCCGFDCIPSDIGLDFVKKQYAKCNFYPSSAEVFIELHSDPKLGSAINYATYESAIESISNISKLNEIRRKSDRAIVPKYGPILKVHKKPRFDKRIGISC